MPLDSSNTPAYFAPVHTDVEPNAKPRNLRQIFRRRVKAKPVFYERMSTQDLPEGWETSTFKFEGLNITYYIARAVEENAVTANLSGLKPEHAVSQEMVEDNKTKGISTIWFNYPNPGRQTGYMDFYKRLSHHFFTSPESPFHQKFPLDIPRLLGGHSTGGQNLLNLALSEETRADYENFAMLVPENSFLDNANAAKHDPLYKRIIFTSYALLNYRKLPHETLLGLGYNNYYALKQQAGSVYAPKPYDTSDFNFTVAKHAYKAAFSLYLVAQTVKEKLGQYATKSKPNIVHRLLSNHFMAGHNGLERLIESFGASSPERLDTTPLPSEFETPTYGQILETRAPGRELSKRILSASDLTPPCPILMVAGKEDHFSSSKPQVEVAKALNAHFIHADAAHRSFEFDANARQQALSFIENSVPEIRQLPERVLDQESEATGNYWPSYSRLTLAKQALMDRFSDVTRAMPRLARLRLRSMHRTQPESVRKPS